jgi:hypothetical protein
MKYNLVQRGFLVKKVYGLKEISLVQRAFRREYPKDGTPNYYVIKNILSNFEKYGSVAHVLPKHKNFGQKREMAKQPESTNEYIICSDEAYFYLTLPLNNQKNRHRGLNRILILE